MPRRARSLLSEYYVHVINRSAHKAPLFERSKDYRDFLRILREGLDRYPVRVVAYCLMSNHWHLVVAPVGSALLSSFMHWVTTTHAIRYRQRRSTCGLGPVYQGRFKSHPIEGVGHLLRVIRYVERNALAASLVTRAEDWPWGSLADRQRSTPAVQLAGAAFLSSRAWIEQVNTTHLLDDVQQRPVPTRRKSVENRPVPLSDLAEDPGAGKGSKERGGVRARRRNDQAHAHVERTKHFRVVKLPRALEPLEQRRNRPALAIK
jgi:putative transposase